MDWQNDRSFESSESSASEKYLLGFIDSNIVGLSHHSGTIHGERPLVGLARELNNPYDPNAIVVRNTHNLSVGYIERPIAAVLSPLIDQNLIQVEAIVAIARNTYRVPCQIYVFSCYSDFNTVKNAFDDAGLKLITESDPSFTLSDSVAVKETRAQKKPSSIDSIFEKVNRSYTSKNPAIQILEPPRTIIKTELLQHQKEALAWLVHRENSDDLPPFWEENEGKFVNILTDYQSDNRPDPLRGGIFADEMGLGKTLTLLSLIAYDKKSQMGVSKKWRTDRKSITFEKRRMHESESSSPDRGFRTNATLVVCPSTVMATWITQLEEHTVTGALKSYLYYGERRTDDPFELNSYDLVLTTYGTLAGEQNMPKMPAKSMHWRRIVLDEAHTIKNFKAKRSLAVTKLNAQCRWAVTGTPIQNGCIDLFSIMAFLRFQPFSVRKQWRGLVQRSLDNGNTKGLVRLQILMEAIALRRTKGMALLGLPPKTIEICYVELSFDERQLYDQLKQETKIVMSRYGFGDSLVPHYSAVLSRILRLRQICTDSKLCNGQSLPLTNIEDASNNPKLLQALLGQAQDGEDFDCPICLSPPTEIMITCCAHIFCRVCILRALQNKKPCCPLCRHCLRKSDLFSAPPESFKADSAEECSSSLTVLSSKASKLIKLLTESRDQHPAAKSVVFSQFRKALLLLEEPLKAAEFKTLRLDGTMNAKHRANVIEQFRSLDGPTVLLASLKASSAGINLTAASRLYFMEPWWNHAVEEQAMDRIHRIGQKEAVKIVRLIAKNSIEEQILALQEKKKQLPRESSGTGLSGMRITEIDFLLDH